MAIGNQTGVTFRFPDHTINTYDLGLTHTHTVKASPVVKRKIVDIPYSDGVIDLTDSFQPRFEERMITLTFEIMGVRADWEDRRAEVYNLLHGRQASVHLPNDTGMNAKGDVEDGPYDWYWEGMVSVDEYVDNGSTATLTINVLAAPYKRLGDLYAGGDKLPDAGFTAIVGSGDTLSRADRRLQVTDKGFLYLKSDIGVQADFGGVTYDIPAASWKDYPIWFDPEGETPLNLKNTAPMSVAVEFFFRRASL